MSRFVSVRFLSTLDDYNSGVYIYKDEMSRALKQYDTVLVPTKYGLSLAVVKETYNEEKACNIVRNNWGSSINDVRKVAEKIKSKVVEERLKKDKAEDLKRKLEAEIKKIDEVEKYRVYADLNPAVAEMLAELEELRG